MFSLPCEVLGEIFEYLELDEKIKCIQINKSFYNNFNQDTYLLNTMDQQFIKFLHNDDFILKIESNWGAQETKYYLGYKKQIINKLVIMNQVNTLTSILERVDHMEGEEIKLSSMVLRAIVRHNACKLLRELSGYGDWEIGSRWSAIHSCEMDEDIFITPYYNLQYELFSDLLNLRQFYNIKSIKLLSIYQDILNKISLKPHNIKILTCIKNLMEWKISF